MFASVRRLSFMGMCLAGIVLTGCQTAPKSHKQAEFIDNAESSTQWFESSVNRLPQQINQSAAFVIFPDVAQWGILIGGGTFGRGAVCNPDGTQIGWAAINTGSIGLQAGVQGFRMLMVIQDQATLTRFKSNQLSGSVNGVLVAADTGTSAAEQFENGVVIYQGANRGLMAGINVGLNLIRYEPLQSGDSAADLR